MKGSKTKNLSKTDLLRIIERIKEALRGWDKSIIRGDGFEDAAPSLFLIDEIIYMATGERSIKT